MKRIYCDCCKFEIPSFEPKYSIEIKRENDDEHILEDVCQDCYERFRNIINNAERWRTNGN